MASDQPTFARSIKPKTTNFKLKMLAVLRTDTTNEDFKKLVSRLDAELKALDGEDHSFYAPLNNISLLKYAVVVYDGDEAVGCGAVKEFETGTMEVKRMYVPPAKRNRGIASRVLMELENWCRELHFKRCVLETGKRQPDAIALYTKSGYTNIPNFGPYAMDENSVCFEKKL